MAEIPIIRNPEFFKLLISQGLLSETDSQNLLRKFNGNHIAALVYLVQGSVTKKEKLCKLWADSLGFAYVDPEKSLIQYAAVQKLPEKFAKKFNVIPLYQFGDAITLATADPGNRAMLSQVEGAAKVPASPVFSLPDDIEDAIEIYYQSTSDLSSFINRITDSGFEGRSKITAEQIKKFAGDQAVQEFTRGLLLMAVKEKASDIHIEPWEDVIRVRFRIDGVLLEKLKLDFDLHQPLVSRLKILAEKDITEKRRPQDGRIKLQLPNKTMDFRFSSVPTIYGEKVVLRILGGMTAKSVPDLSDLNFSKNLYRNMISILKSPNGVFFVTGPTGSGKTTTLYAALKFINKNDVNIMTIEDPVEYRLEGLNQLQVNNEIDFNFASALRAFLRQDPDIILIGEIRDKETAKIATQAALTGHMVMATMHTNNAMQAVTRLIEIGVEPFLVAPSIIGVLSQRLVRKICGQCKARYALTPAEIERFFTWDEKQEVFFYKGQGCEQCQHTGYSGRIAIHELFTLDDTLRSMISREASTEEIKEYMKKSNFEDIRYDGMKKVLRGLTTIEELDRVALAEGE